MWKLLFLCLLSFNVFAGDATVESDIIDQNEMRELRSQLAGLQTYRYLTQEHYRRQYPTHDTTERYSKQITEEIIQLEVENKIEEIREGSPL